MTRARLAPEVVQASAMDCGPAALKCLLDGHGLPVSFGRLREACQTGVDGASIDDLEEVAGALGLLAEQALIPQDHLLLPQARSLPAIVVTDLPDGSHHFVVVWARTLGRVQVMDPAVGRRWLPESALLARVHRHELAVPAAAWRDFAADAAFLQPLNARLAALGLRPARCSSLMGAALADQGWFSLAALDAAVRLAQSLCDAGAVSLRETGRIAESLFAATVASPDDIHAHIPEAYWTVAPGGAEDGAPMLRVRGAVILRVGGVGPGRPEDLPPELQAAASEPPTRLGARLVDALRQEGLVPAVALGVAAAVGVTALMLEALLFRGMFEIGQVLQTPVQRAAAAIALLTLLALMLSASLPIGFESARLGRRLELRLRMSLLRKLVRMQDQYFQSRATSDMADRAHALHLARGLPTLALLGLQTALELVMTTLAVGILAPEAWPVVLLLLAVAGGAPVLTRRALNEQDLRTRTHSAALNTFYLDALLGSAPIRAHSADDAVRRRHEALLVEWARSLRGLQRSGLMLQAVQSVACGLGVGLVLWVHFRHAGGVGGTDLLLVYWALKLPNLGSQLAGVAQQVPAQRSMLLRLMEPLGAAEEAPVPAVARTDAALGFELRGARISAGGHEVLGDLDLRVKPGEHVAIVGPSGAGKSTLLAALLGWRSIDEGRFLVDGEDLGEGAGAAIRRQAAWIDPGVQIWNRSLLDNLAYANDQALPEELGRAVAASGVDSVMRHLPDGLQTRLGEGGGRLSGGQGQRVRFARGLLTEDARIALLDEPFRGLDRGERRRLLDEARTAWAQTTLLFVTHDLEETLDFQRVLVVEDGRIVEDGPPRALAEADTRYAALLAGESELRRTRWNGTGWRHLRLEDGAVTERETVA